MEFILHKTTEKFIITSDEKIKDGDLLFNLKAKSTELFTKDFKYDSNDVWYKKVIAQQDQIDFSALSEAEQKEIGWFDVERLALEEIPFNNMFGTPSWMDNNLTYRREWIKGFQKAQELLSDRFDKEDVLNAMEIGFELGRNFDKDNPNTGLSWLVHQKDNCTQSLSQPKSWKVELEMEEDMICENVFDGSSSRKAWVSKGWKPKFTNGKIKITKLL